MEEVIAWLKTIRDKEECNMECDMSHQGQCRECWARELLDTVSEILYESQWMHNTGKILFGHPIKDE